MSEDERAIRNLIAIWIAASKSGDTATVLSLMADDVLFLVPGHRPFGKEAFAAASEQMKDMSFEGESEVEEIEICGDRAWCRTHLRVTITPPGQKAERRSGHTLSILRKKPGGQWVLFRDANLLVAEPEYPSPTPTD
jgi:uncharacterized protein (TIGR02246 family)